jgi:pilus assembly protein Flp/PilA
MLRKFLRNRKGQGLVEYALLIAGVALVAIVGVSVFGEKTSDMIDAVATVLPGADGDDNGTIGQGHLIETTGQGSGAIQLDLNSIVGNSGTARLGNNLAGNTTNGFDGLITDAVPQQGNTGS